jgi:hypothetical protein
MKSKHFATVFVFGCDNDPRAKEIVYLTKDQIDKVNKYPGKNVTEKLRNFILHCRDLDIPL